MMNLCPRKIFCKTPLLELKARAQASPLPVNTATQAHSSARGRIGAATKDSSCHFRNTPRSSSQRSTAILISPPPSMLLFSFPFQMHGFCPGFIRTHHVSLPGGLCKQWSLQVIQGSGYIHSSVSDVQPQVQSAGFLLGTPLRSTWIWKNQPHFTWACRHSVANTTLKKHSSHSADWYQQHKAQHKVFLPVNGSPFLYYTHAENKKQLRAAFTVLLSLHSSYQDFGS